MFTNKIYILYNEFGKIIKKDIRSSSVFLAADHFGESGLLGSGITALHIKTKFNFSSPSKRHFLGEGRKAPKKFKLFCYSITFENVNYLPKITRCISYKIIKNYVQ